jgi:hypothetical protein
MACVTEMLQKSVTGWVVYYLSFKTIAYKRRAFCGYLRFVTDM